MATVTESNKEVRQQEPSSLWNYFADLNAVPRASKNEAQVIEFMKKFGESLGLETVVDHIGNVVVRKPATSGLENRMTVVLQSHLDMVHQKNADTKFDFATQGIEMQVDGDWINAAGTTLGADNGIGVAAIMAVLAADDVEHPPLEALFTIDEETGMTGAKELKGGLLNGQILLNLDTEDDDELTIGCAGGVDVTANMKYDSDEAPAGSTGFRLTVRGLTGGHSGMDIHRGRGNANKIMNRILWNAFKKFEIRVSEIDGGGLRNAIPRESFAVIVVGSDQADEFKAWVDSQSETILKEYVATDPEAELTCEAQGQAPAKVLPANLQKQLLGALYSVLSGIHRMSPEISDLVQTSNNLARVLVKDGELKIGCLTRSSVNSERDDLANSLTAVLELIGADIDIQGDYPGWKPVPDSKIVKLMSSLYEEMFSEPAHVSACHAGLECGIIGTNYPDMQMISFGPNIRGAHSPDERVQISSVQKFWKFFQETLKRIPEA